MAGREVEAARREHVEDKLTWAEQGQWGCGARASVELPEAEKNERIHQHLRTLKVGMTYFSEKHGACEVIGIEGDRIRMRIQDYKTPRGGGDPARVRGGAARSRPRAGLHRGG